jgi:hypothetical protein
MEKHVADLITEAAESHDLLPWNQMGARKKRSTLSAVSLLSSSIHTAWKAQSGCVVSMLSLDLAGAFDNVSHERLLYILRRKGFPKWLVDLVQSFLTARKTRIKFPGYESEWIQTQTGIPQGSPLSPILFLFFISELLEEFQRIEGDTMAFGFVDDTNLITWGRTAEENCRRLTAAHDRCIAWAKRHGASFAPEKYQLMHFTRRRRHDSADLASTVRIAGHEAILQKTSLRVLGVWVDPKLQWKEHIRKAVSKGAIAFEAMSRITASTWGPSMRRSRLLYTAVVRPTVLYGAQVWGVRTDGGPQTPHALKPIQKIQNQCLRKIVGAYKRTPTAALERETAIPPIPLYVDTIALQRATETAANPVEAAKAEALDNVWKSLAGRRRNAHRPPAPLEALRSRAKERETEMLAYIDHQRDGAQRDPNSRARRQPQRRRRPATLIAKWADLEWRRQWRQKSTNRTETTWKTPWTIPTISLYEGLSKAEATALFLLRTEVLGLNAWLHSIGVPEVHRRCDCGWLAQTVHHILFFCPRLERTELAAQCPSETLEEVLSRKRSAQAAARWLVASGVLAQFRVARAIDREDVRGYQPFQRLENW